MIKTFADKLAEQLWCGGKPKKLPASLRRRALDKLQILNAANDIVDLYTPPGNRLESLKGEFKGYWSIRINDQWRIMFRFIAPNAYDVTIIDYH